MRQRRNRDARVRHGGCAAIGLIAGIGVTLTGNVIRNWNGAPAKLYGISDLTFHSNVIEWDSTNTAPVVHGVSIMTYTGDITNISIQQNVIAGYWRGIYVGPTSGHQIAAVYVANNVIVATSQGITLDVGVNAPVMMWQNRIDAPTSASLKSLCQLNRNRMPTFAAPVPTYYWEAEGSRKTYSPRTATDPVPMTPTPAAGDVYYNSAPVAGAQPSAGGAVGWVYTGSAWAPFGALS